MVKLVVGVVAVVVLSVSLWAFEPWRVWTSSTVDEAVPGTTGQDASIRDVAETVVPAEQPAAAEPSAAPKSSADPKPPASPAPVEPTQSAAPVVPEPVEPAPVEPVPVEPPKPQLRILLSGDFEDAEHDTSGTAYVVETAEGDRFLRFEGLDTSDGPDLYVGLSDAPSGGSWGSYDDGRYVQLAQLKATNGNQNYDIPDNVDLAGLTTAVIWCDRFNVAFGTAALAA